jgi:hypothetical protein
MSEKHNPENSVRQPMIYQISLEELLDHQWTDWFEGLAITLKDNNQTLLTCQVVDQAALYGLLKKVRDLGLTLISVIRVEPGQIVNLE